MRRIITAKKNELEAARTMKAITKPAQERKKPGRRPGPKKKVVEAKGNIMCLSSTAYRIIIIFDHFSLNYFVTDMFP